MKNMNGLNKVAAGCRNLLITGSSVILLLSACSTESAPAAREAPKRTMAPEDTEPQAEAIDTRRVEASSKVVVEQEPLAMAPAEAEPGQTEEPAEDMQEGTDMCPEGGMCAEEQPATMAAVKPASKPVVQPKKSLIR